ncbi:MAG: hypothetical protein K6G64_08685 [Eubacterium sp.]|nr:hypothetical protein [Eubacterium sp.]
MIDLNDINNNTISNNWKKRYAEQPIEIKKKLDLLNDSAIKDYQLQVIKREKIYPEIGDVFRIAPKKDISLYGVVINNHVDNINGKDLIVIVIFNSQSSINNREQMDIMKEALLLPPQIVGQEYWTKGYFSNIDKIKNVECKLQYGFYSIGKKKNCDEYGKEINYKPELFDTFGVATISGIAKRINQELIIRGMI